MCKNCVFSSSLVADRKTEKKENVALHADYVFDNIFMHACIDAQLITHN